MIRVAILLGPERHLLATAISTMLARMPSHLVTHVRVDQAGHPLQIEQSPCDVAIVDRTDIAVNLKRAVPGIHTVMFVKTRDPESVMASVHAGAAACVDDHITVDGLVDVIRRVTAGEAVYEPSVLIACLQRYGAPRGVPDRTAKLSQRELEVLSVLARGASSAEAAKHVDISLNTLRTHIRNVLVKTGARSQLEAVIIALREGRISLEGHDL